MKRLLLLITFLVLLSSFSSCATTVIPNSEEAKAKLEEKGYQVNIDILYGDLVEAYGITQLTVLDANKDDDKLQVYFFASHEDCNAFYQIRAHALTENAEVLKKNKYSIYLGTENAVKDFLS